MTMRKHLRYVVPAIIAIILTLPAGLLAVPQSQAATSGTARAATPSPAQSPLQTASMTAKATGKAVPVPSQTTATSTTEALPDGQFSTTTSVLPVRVQQHGAWVPVSATLQRNADGGYSPTATPSGLVLSGGGNGAFATLTSPSGKRLSLTFPFPLPAPRVSGATAVYGDVLPGVDLDITATDQGGFDEVLEIKNAAAAANPDLRQLRIATTADGLTVQTDAAGNMTAAPVGGAPQFVAPPPQMWDSASLSGTAQATAAAAPAASGATAARAAESSAAAPAAGAHVARIGMSTAAGALVLVPDQTMLTQSTTKFPVFVDPSVNPASSGTSGYVETQQGCPSYHTWDVAQTNGEGIGDQNYPGSACEGLYRSFYQINTSNLNSSMVVSSATLLTAETYGSDQSCSHTWPVTVSWTGGINSSTDWSNQPAAISSIQTMWPKTAWCGTQDVNFNVTSLIQQAAGGNWANATLGLYGDETLHPDSACSPNSEYNCGFMRFNNNPSITTVFDIAPNVPANTGTTPASVDNGTVTGPGCGSNPAGWIGATALGANNGSQVTLNSTVTSNITGEQVRAQYTLTDNSAGSAVVASPDSAYVPSGSPADVPVGIALLDGHAYSWTASAYDGTLASAATPACHFKVDATPPTVPAVSSSAFPPAGSTPSSPPVTGTTGTFGFTSSDPVPTGCSGANPVPGSDRPMAVSSNNCLASGVAYYQYSFNTPVPASGASSVNPGGTVSYTASRWGTNILYVNAVDNAGNVSQTTQYNFYVKWDPQAPVTAGDVDGDGIPDLLATNTAGDLLLYPGGADPAVAPTVAGTPASSPDGSAWGTFQVTHRGSMSQNSVDDLFAHKGGNLYLYPNNLDDPGAAPQFGDKGNASLIGKPSCAATASNASNCSGYDSNDWSEATQILAPGDLYGSSGSGLPDLLTVEDGQLWLYEGEFGNNVDTPVLLGSGGGSTNWNGMTIIAPGEVNGVLTLWARDDSTGAIYSWPLTLDSNGVPELGTAKVSVPVTATSGTAVGGVTLTSAAYPFTVSSGPLTGGTCGASDLTACPGLYAQDTSGNLWYYQGQPASGSASPLSGSRMFIGNVNGAATADLPLSDGSGSVAHDISGNGNNGTLNGSVSWAADPSRGTVAAFNGPAGYIQLPNDLVERSTELSVSLWFKTTTAGQVLLSTGQEVPGSTAADASDAMPVLYVGSNGLLYGEFWNDQAKPIASTAAVDDGKWHNVVITGNADTQSLYVDGTQAGSLTGAIANVDPLDFIGAGYVNTNGWTAAPATGWSYFTGDASGFEFYDYPLSPPQVSAVHQLREALTQIS
jgi:Concanavalin A-like lectin/glucanases superfamily